MVADLQHLLVKMTMSSTVLAHRYVTFSLILGPCF